MQIKQISLYQKRFWLEWKLTPCSSKYHTPLFYEFKGSLNIEALSLALSCYVNEFHRANCHYFKESNAHLTQHILPSLPVECQRLTLDLTDNNIENLAQSQEQERAQTQEREREREQERVKAQAIENEMQKFCNQPFNLAEPPLFRFALLTISENHYILMLNFHHIITDAYTGKFLVQNLSALYNHFAVNHPKPLPPSPSFEDYLEREQEFYSEKDKTEDLLYWQNKLAHFPLSIDLSALKNSQSNNNPNPKSLYFNLDTPETNVLKNFAKNHHTTLFITLATVLALTLARHSQQKAIVLTYPINTRPLGFQNVPGCFVNNVPFIFHCDKEFTFAELLKAGTLERKENKLHQRCSLTDIIHAEKNKRLIADDYFNVSILEAFLNPNPLSFHQVENVSLKLAQHQAFNDLSLFYQCEDTLEFRIDYQNCDETLMQKFAERFLLILKHCIHFPMDNIFQFPILTKDEKLMIEQFNDTQKVIKKTTILDLFQEQCKKCPNNIAVVFENKTISYQELNVASNELASTIIKNNPAQFVALMLDKSIEFVIGLFAILKAGRAYVPIDILDTPNRIQQMLVDADIKLILTTQKVINSHPVFNQISPMPTTLTLDKLRDHDNDQLFDKNLVHISPNDLIYLLYTSGTTGKPKGVLIEHMSVVNVMLDLKQRFNFNDQHKILSLSAVIFDIYTLELFLPLISGGVHIIAAKETVIDPKKFIKSLKKSKPTFVQATPSFWSMMVPYINKELKEVHVLCGGEKLDEKLGHQLKSKSIDVWNLYGPSETTIYSSAYKIKSGQPVFIGSPLSNTKLKVLDDYLNPVPIGVKAELYISGIGLARGYLNNEDLTHKNFIVHPKTQERLYKTGDIARMNEKGILDYCARMDAKVKIRGHFIDLLEIEHVLKKHPEILNAVVVAKIEENFTEIVAYYTLKKPFIMDRFFSNTTLVKPLDLHQHLKQYLKEPMLPQAFIELDALPLTLNGKIDRLHLPLPKKEHYLHMDPHQTKLLDIIELQLKTIWQAVLHRSNINQNDNFFMIGGNSLLAVFLLTKINEQFKVNFTVAKILKHNTIKAQALLLRKDQNTKPYYEPIIQFNRPQHSKLPPLFLIHPGVGGAEVYYQFSEHFNKNIPLYALDSYNLNSGAPFVTRLEDLAKLYIQYIKTIQEKGPYFLGGWSLGGIIAFEMAKQLHQDKSGSVQMLYLIDPHIYQPGYLQYLQTRVSIEGLIAELSNERGQYLSTLPKKYLQHMLASLKNDLIMLTQYRFTPYEGAALLFKTIKKTRLNLGLFEDKYNGWKKMIQNLERVMVEANHLNLIESDHVKKVTTLLEEHFTHLVKNTHTEYAV